MRRLAALMLLVGALGPAGQDARAQARPDAGSQLVPGCAPAIHMAEAGGRLPPGLLGAIAIVESGRADPRSGRVGAWPWTINVAGVGHFYETKGDAIAAVQAAQAQGIASIDVGCMQVNLMHHPNAFASLDLAFDPEANAAYAAGFLGVLFRQSGSWPEAAASYHSATPGLREDYQRRVMAGWGDAAKYGFTGVAATPRPGATSAIVIATGTQYAPALRSQLATAAGDHLHLVALGLLPAPAPIARPPRSRTRITMAALRGAGG